MNFIELRSGTSVEGADIHAYRSDVKGDNYLYLLGGVHGDEVEGVYVLNHLFEWLKTDEAQELPIVVVPILNVDGYRQGTRTNAHGVDLNRNLETTNWSAEVRQAKYHPGTGPMSEPENKYLDKLFNKFPPKQIITFHSWKPLLNYNGDCKEIAEFIEQFNKYPSEPDVGYPTPGSLGNYAPEKYKCPVLTYECPLIAEGKTLKEIWDENEQGLKAIMNSDMIKNKIKY
ncbi:succinylglutamate desuccinylase/aspartoacylase domain protein [Bacteriovorax sp. BSW11_IV]|uniref:M14 family murein peptide amidase A n=1 Tax=Bacteriovorax sp. BSW11_IV TaxID=1353529 RepID=UPI000389E135|nr:M14 family murein peptide amidase A [Bacteriovorax sp. BSW11_IV]EQC49371.1 succinylglutamate desuccinylase/aspartoacylase domain protein [Bacteriovorax sp. BSW11_IV]